MYMQLDILAHIWRPVQEPYNKVHTRLVDGRRHPRRVHFSSQAHLHRAHFLTAPATAAGAMYTIRHGSVPTVRTKRQIPYTAGGLPCRKVRTARPVFAVYTFLRKPFPASLPCTLLGSAGRRHPRRVHFFTRQNLFDISRVSLHRGQKQPRTSVCVVLSHRQSTSHRSSILHIFDAVAAQPRSEDGKERALSLLKRRIARKSFETLPYRRTVKLLDSRL